MPTDPDSNSIAHPTTNTRRDFEQHVLPLLDSLYGAAARLTRNPDEAEDLVQDAVLRAYRFWDTFKPGTNIKAWMFTILRNTFINGYHREGRRRRLSKCVASQMLSVGPVAAVAYSGRPPGPEEGVCTEHERERILDAIGSLREEYRTVVILADYEGLPYKQIAEIMGTPIGTVMSRLHRARKILRELLMQYAHETGRIEDPASSESTIDLGDYRRQRQTA